MLRSIKAKIGLILIINFVFICVTILSTFITLNNQETDGVVINLAGRQRMLSQKMTKEVLLGMYDKGQLEALKKTASNFEKVLNGLINGDSELNLPKTDNPTIAAHLQKVQDLWKPFYDNIKQIVANTSGLPEEESLQYIKSQNMSLMLEMDQVVKMFESEAIEKNSNLKQIQLLFLCITALVVSCGFYFMNKIIIKPVLTINETAKKISAGDLRTRLELNNNDEIGDLASSFNIMIANIQKGIDDLEYEKKTIENKVEEAVRESEAQKDYLSKNVDKMLLEMDKFSKGDLTVNLVTEKKDEIGKLFNGFTNAVSNIKNLIEKVSEAVHATASASAQISSSTEEMAAGAQEQNTQTGEVAAAIEQMSKTVIETTRNTTTAADNAKRAGDIAGEGGRIVSETVDGIQKIAEVVSSSSETVTQLEKSSDQIGEIIQVIDDIADQTNLLALNAAIEAARAGEQGRGFAVVADEVRKLAERTTKATKEIADMIKEIQKKTGEAVVSMHKGTAEVEKGKMLANKAGESLKEIINAAVKVVDDITQVASASEEQSNTAEQVSRSIDSISNITHESSAGIQQVAKAAEDLNRLTDNLQNLISRFKVDSNENDHYSVRQNGKLVKI